MRKSNIVGVSIQFSRTPIYYCGENGNQYNGVFDTDMFRAKRMSEYEADKFIENYLSTAQKNTDMPKAVLFKMEIYHN